MYFLIVQIEWSLTKIDIWMLQFYFMRSVMLHKLWTLKYLTNTQIVFAKLCEIILKLMQIRRFYGVFIDTLLR